jgi:NDP-sugar pyrophosphorylase family protein
MDVKAILMVGGRNTTETGLRSNESVVDIPIAFLDVLGQPVLERVLQRLQHFGVSAVTLVSEATNDSEGSEPIARRSTLRPDLTWIQAAASDFWTAAEAAFSNYADAGAELVLAVRVGPYVEVDYEDLIQHHLDKRCRITMTVDSAGVPLDIFVLTASRRNDASTLFRTGLQKMRTQCEHYQVKGYVNRLQNAGDLRQLGLDGLLAKNGIRPVGTESKPGVWLADGVRIHHKARIVAPAFIGARSKVRASALITRGTIIEHHAEVDCGTVVENSTVLPYTYIGAGLDVMHSVVGFHHLNHVLRGADVEIFDQRLVGMSAVSPISRALGSAAALFAFLPKQMYRGLFAASPRKSAADLPEALDQPAAVLETAALDASPECGAVASEFPDPFVVSRRYGNQ